ncbi:hypothetical protein MIND_00893000 [Mycena indigotica]|uniref:Uncharacterized protein n=1 Tax=Mycena indigotica TaxID=2126181 RepID=A0A8H6VZG8_9AGAR|nr:uncharacterized protein MIND_00893000 [Mycena indigotica]KAF7299432.1 hypothetical protein MIND_00893000 [Mycena indigotica]
MALTQSARPAPGPSWDEEVVPALRKRLQGESRVLSKRISAAVSISSLEDVDQPPRPSYTQRTSTETAKSQASASSKRARTYSQPKLSDLPSKSRPTRIPKATTRNGTTGLQSPTPDSPMLNGRLLSPPTLTREPSQDTIHIPAIQRQTSGLLNEQPPFMPGPGSANSHDEAPPRPSNESEERPFEHWYRGEVSRNGGVGELKMGKRQEMLEIANYGHTLKQKQALAAATANDSYPRRRKRSESAAVLDKRESLYLDEEHVNGVGRVLDEGPLTDVEMSDGDVYGHDRERSTTPTQPSRQATSPPPALVRGASEPPTFPNSSLSQSSRQLQNPSKRAATASPSSASSSKKPRGGTPNSTPRTSKPKATKPQRTKPDDNRRSVANYPSPGDGDEDMSNAIPTWTQPLAPSTGRWDDVVLPVVARKKGLDGYYSADGSPKPRREEQPIAPAAGTFGWDHTKYRPPREDGAIAMDEFGRPMPVEAKDDESQSPQGAFGNPLSPLSEHEKTPVGPQARLKPHLVDPPRTASPAPFSDYRGPSQIDLSAEAAKLEQNGGRLPPPEEDEGAGCCKCVVM